MVLVGYTGLTITEKYEFKDKTSNNSFAMLELMLSVAVIVTPDVTKGKFLVLVETRYRQTY
jgi:hypothetical protein